MTSIGYDAFRDCYKLIEVINHSPLNIVVGVSSYYNGGIGYYAKHIITDEKDSYLTTDKNGYIFYDDGNNVYLIGHVGSDTELVLPKTSPKSKAYEVYQYAFYSCTGLTSITIPSGVTSIGAGAFSGCSSLESMTLPFVGGSRKCASDTYQYPFGYIFGTSSYTGGVATKQYYYGSSTSDTTNSTFYIPESLKSVTITGGNILYGAFYNCTSLTSITIPDGVTRIGSGAFSGCTGLTSITIPNSVTSIGYDAFYRCTGLTSITIPNSVTSIGNYAFYGCSSLTSITIPNSVTSIGYHAFYNTAYYNDSSHWENGVLYIGNHLIVAETSISGDCTIKSGTKCIGDYAFSGCTELTSVTIPNNVTSIGYSAFGNCTGLKKVHISDVTAWCKVSFDSQDANPLTYAHNLYLNDSLITDLTIPDSVQHIGAYAFYECTNLKTVTFAENSQCSSIGVRAFYDCTGLTSITIPDSVTSIGYAAFSGCTGLTSITIPDSVTSIGSSAFSGCTGLTSITIPDSVTSIGKWAFYGCTGLTSITIPNSVTSIGYYAFEGCTKLRTIYCQASSKPSGWDSGWNDGCDARVLWNTR